jgi:hypothetical protein
MKSLHARGTSVEGPLARCTAMMWRARVTLAALLAGLCAAPAWAHSASDAYLTLTADRGAATARTLVHGQWDVALRDLDFALTLDADGDGAIRWSEVRAREAAIARYVYRALAVRGDGAACRIVPGSQKIAEHADGAYAALFFDIACDGRVSALTLDYALFFAIDPSHRGIVVIRTGDDVATALLAPERRSVRWTP